MPGAITHLKTAHYILKNEIASVSQPKQFYLGSISPDSVNVNGHADKSIRWPAHLRDSDLDVWLNNVKQFYELQKSETKSDFLLGYIIHIITDIVWDKYFEKQLCGQFLTAGIPMEMWKSYRWAELYGYEKLSSRSDLFKNDVLLELKNAAIESVGTLKAEQVEDYRNCIADLNIPEGRLPRFIDDEFMNRFYKKTAEIVKTVI